MTEERKVVTALFCDLVGFTATSDGADPEDVDRMLTSYFDMARAHIELHGGLVEKFIGDAVVGIFGVPVAHGDDPERAVRAALRIAEDATTLRALGGSPLRLRVGINTGPALVRLDATPGSGERFITGDSVNTASRIQSVAPEMGVAVGVETWRGDPASDRPTRSSRRRRSGARPPRCASSTPWPRAPPSGSTSGVARQARSSGGPRSSASLTDCLDDAISTRSPRFATIVGEPGLGKSRLVAELLEHVDSHLEVVTWRQGRCLPYGSGISFWALGEIVKAPGRHPRLGRSIGRDRQAGRRHAGGRGARLVPRAPAATGRHRRWIARRPG